VNVNAPYYTFVLGEGKEYKYENGLNSGIVVWRVTAPSTVGFSF